MKFALLGNPHKPRIRDAAEALITYIKRKHAKIIADEELKDIVGNKCPTATPEELATVCDVAITLGGDGTVMKAAHRIGFKGLPILGINTGTLGFLAAGPVEEMKQAVADVLNDNIELDKRTCITAKAEKNVHADAINEFVVERRSSVRMIKVDMYVDEKYLNTYIADGIIIATPTGSTAYSLSAGGPIVSTASKVFVITPIAPHALTARPLIVPDNCSIRMVVTSDTGNCTLVADGQDAGTLVSPATIHLQRSNKSVTFIRRKTFTEYDILRAKLLWGKDARAEAAKHIFRSK